MELLCRFEESKAQFIRIASLAFCSIFDAGVHRERGARSPLSSAFHRSTEDKLPEGNLETQATPQTVF